MKELILFSFIVLFIACQNQQIPELKADFKPQTPATVLAQASEFGSMACGNETAETLDLIKEIENQELPGIHHREVALRSELVSEMNEAELICVSQVSGTHEDEFNAEEPMQELAVLIPQTPEASEITPVTWAVLTEKWELVRESKACELQISNAPDAKCEGPALWTEEGKLFSARFESSIHQASN